MESPFAENEHPKVTNVRSKAANEHSKAYLGCLMIWEHFIVYRFS
jgi:hypothetical protein